uniref:Uncharacterized protein n=1 Tax=Janibacter limosus TaxID=53458 RepID=A0AC61U3N2_9MICO|nr:hypothetical protein [Janibacter limosus]
MCRGSSGPSGEALVADLGIGGGTIIRELGELQALIDSDPFPGLTHGRGSYLVATFLKDGAGQPADLPADPDPRMRPGPLRRAGPSLPRGHRQQRTGQDPGLHAVARAHPRQGHHHPHRLTVQRIATKLALP